MTFRKSFAAALLGGAMAVTPALLHAQSTTTTNGSASGSVTAQPANGASRAAGANAAGAANTATSPNGATTTTNGTYGGMGTDQSTTTNKVKKSKDKMTSPDNSQEQQQNPIDQTTQPH
jgi:hypothetical protein